MHYGMTWSDVMCSCESVRVHRLCRRLYPTAADDAAPGTPGGDGCPRTAAVDTRSLTGQRTSPQRSRPSPWRRRDAAWGAWRAAAAQQGQQTVVGEGKVIAVVPGSNQIVVDHKEIPGFMDAMTMGYRIEPASLLEGVKAGDTYPLYH